MDNANGIAVATIVTSAGVALLIAYQSRRQLRHLELYRKDPKAGLKPPDTAIVRWLKRHGLYAYGMAMCMWGLSQQLGSDAPLSRRDVVIVAVEAAGFGLLAALYMIHGLVNLLVRLVDAIREELTHGR